MMSRMDRCADRASCGLTGHRLVEGIYVRCPCREEDERERVLGTMYAPDLVEVTELHGKGDNDIVIEGPLASIRRHVGRVLLDAKKRGNTWITIDAYRLIEIFLGEDKDYGAVHQAVDPDLLILLLGFADPRNKYLPELILQTLVRRELHRKPTWIIMGIPLNFVASKYNSALQDRLNTFDKVKIK